MKLIKRLGRRVNPNSKRGYDDEWGLFFCEVCGKEVVKCYHNGIRQKTYGCQKIKHGGCNGHKSSRLLQTWYSMKDRCYGNDPHHVRWYKDKGILVCDKWKDDFPAFRKWSLKNGYKNNLQIDRINNDGDYSPGNCQFLTPAENSRKRPNTKLSLEKARKIRTLYKNGTHLSYREVGEKYGVVATTIMDVINNKIWKDQEVSI